MLETTQTGINLYVTFVEKEGPFLKIWGQTDKNNSVYVEQFLMGAGPQFDLGVAKILPEQVQLNMLVCAKYKDSKYYRARVLNNSFLREGFIEVSFLDYGNRDVVPIDNVRSLQSFPTSFISVPPLASGFIFAEAHCVGGGDWNDTIFESIVKEIKYREVHCQLLSPATQYYLIKLFIDGTDLCSVLIQRGLMQPISLQAQQAVLLSMSMQRQTQSSNITSMTSPPNNLASAGLNTYKASSLEPGCLYPVYVSYVNDGPCHFSVQLKNSEEVLVKLMNEINAINLRLLEDVPLPGTICLSRCQEDGNICRAVVTSEVDNQFKVFYVDFGNYEVVPLDSLYQIPFKYVLPKVMAIRVCLNGVEKSTVTLEMQRTFKQFVDNRLLHMKVIPAPQRMAIPKCELWDPETKTSALDVVNRAARHAYPEPISLTRGFSQLVKVSYVYSCNRFYVQLSSKETELCNLMAELQEICQTNEPMDPTSLKTGLPCCALYEADGQWYRSQVVEVVGDNVVVRYIDYGNEEPVPSAQLKNIDGEQLTVLRPQAIECCLNGYQNMEDDAERDQLLDELILEGEFTMKVVDMLNKKALVDLFDDANCNVASLLLDRLAMAKSQVSPALVVQAGNKIEHKKSFGQQNGPAKGKDGHVFRFDKEDRNDRQDWGDRQGRGERRDRGDRGDRGERGDRGDRGDRPSRERRDFNKAPNENWRQDGNKEFRKYDRNSNEGGQDSWRQNNKGFSPKHQNKYDKQPESDAWQTNATSPNNNDEWNSNAPTNQNNQDDWGGSTNAKSGGGDAWENTPTAASSDNWNTPANNRGDNNYGGRGNTGGRFNDDRGDRGGDRGRRFNDDRGDRGGDRGGKFGGRPRDGGYRNKSNTRSEHSNEGSEKGYQKGPRTSSRNDHGNKFQKNYDKPRYNNSFQASTDDSWNVSAVSPTIDAAPVTATYGSRHVVGTEANVTISWFHNPSHFYLQLVDSQEEFKRLMEDIQEFYKSRKPENITAVGAPIIGLFPEDNVLYRAQVLEITGNQYKIYYVDFGNVSTVTKVWSIDRKFIKLPAQAIVCSLRDVAPPGGTGIWPEADSYSGYFEKESFLCRFIDEDENKTYVNLSYNSEEISEMLVRDGFAVSTKSSIPPVEIPLLLGQQFRAIVKSVNNLADIILALECGSVVCCSMHNLDTATETYEDTLKAMLEQTVIVYVDNVIDDKLEITLYDTEGNKLTIVEPDEGAFDVVESLCPILVLRSKISGYVSYAEETFVYIQMSEYVDQVAQLLEQLFEYYETKEKEESNIIPEEEQICAVHSEDANWYRGKVISFDDETVTVLYVDYGNTEVVKFDALRELAPQFREPSTFCLKVNIGAEATPYTDKDVTASIFYGEEGWEGTVYVAEHTAEDSTEVAVTSADTGLPNSSYENGQTAPVQNVDDNIDPLMEEALKETVALAESTSTQKGTPVFMSHIDSPNEFYLQLLESLDAIDQLQSELQEKIPDMPVLETPSAGMLCAAPFSADQQWYRAEILDADDDITTVRFVDFGNTDVIDNNTTQIKTLSPELLSLAVYATKCSLRVKPLEEEWSPLCLEVFEQLTAEGLVADFLHQDGKLNYVELYLNEKKISEVLVEEGLAQSAQMEEEDNSAKGKLTGFVSHLNSPSEFWMQLENCIDDLEWIAEQLSSAENFPELEDLTPGTLCAALFPEDQMWYRARILSNTVAGIELLFIDYGNSCTGSSLRQLPEDLVIFQPLAMKCSLQKPKDVASWSEAAAARFSELSADGETIFAIKKLSTGETSVVQLLLNEEDIVTMLLETPPTESATATSTEDDEGTVRSTDEVEDSASHSTEKSNPPRSTEDGYVTEAENLESLRIQVAAELKADTYKLESADGKSFDALATEKFKDINQEGTTLYQIEFLEENTVRIYLEGKDIRSLLTPYIYDEVQNDVLTEPLKSNAVDMPNDAIEETNETETEDNPDIEETNHSEKLPQHLELPTKSEEISTTQKIEVSTTIEETSESDNSDTTENLKGKISELTLINETEEEDNPRKSVASEEKEKTNRPVEINSENKVSTAAEKTNESVNIDTTHDLKGKITELTLTNETEDETNRPEEINATPEYKVSTTIEDTNENVNIDTTEDLKGKITELTLTNETEEEDNSRKSVASAEKDETNRPEEINATSESKVSTTIAENIVATKIEETSESVNIDTTEDLKGKISGLTNEIEDEGNPSKSVASEEKDEINRPKDTNATPENIVSATIEETSESVNIGTTEDLKEKSELSLANETEDEDNPRNSVPSEEKDETNHSEEINTTPETKVLTAIEKISETEDEDNPRKSLGSEEKDETNHAEKINTISETKVSVTAEETSESVNNDTTRELKDDKISKVSPISINVAEDKSEANKEAENRTTSETSVSASTEKSTHDCPKSTSQESSAKPELTEPAEQTKDFKNQSKVLEDLKTSECDNVSPRLSRNNSPICSRESSRPSSRSSKRFSYDDKILPGYLSRPESPSIEDQKEQSDAEIASLLDTVISKVTESNASDSQPSSRPHSRLSHDERLIPGVVYMPSTD